MAGWGEVYAVVVAAVDELAVSIRRGVLWRRYLVVSLGNPSRMISSKEFK